MAISKALEEYLKTLPQETQDVLRPLADKNPGLGEGWLRQADYDRMMDEAKISKKEAKEANDKAWAYYNEQVAKFKELSDEKAAAYEKLTTIEAENLTLKQKVEAAMAGGGDDMNQESLDKLKGLILEEVGKRGYVSQAEVDRIAQEKAKELQAEAVKNFYTNDFPTATRFMAELNDIQFDHNAEFKEKLPREEFAKYMQDNHLLEPRKAYDDWIRDRRLEMKIEAARKEGAEKREQEIRSQQIPGTGVTPGPDSMGHLQLRLTPKREGMPDIPKDVEPGSGALAAMAASELRAEGKI